MLPPLGCRPNDLLPHGDKVAVGEVGMGMPAGAVAPIQRQQYDAGGCGENGRLIEGCVRADAPGLLVCDGKGRNQHRQQVYPKQIADE